MYKIVQRQSKGEMDRHMAKHRILSLAIVLSVACSIALVVRGETKAAARESQTARGGAGFVGEVVSVDLVARSMTLRSGGSKVNFDISNPVLQGYGNLAGIKKKDRVRARYTADGIHIAKSSAIAGKSDSDTVAAPAPVQTPKKPLRIARRVKTDGKSFTDVDNNKDGKITPIELSVIIPNLTLEQFRQYDKNHDGYLDKVEFEQIKLP
jgi:hypothetical protein